MIVWFTGKSLKKDSIPSDHEPKVKLTKFIASNDYSGKKLQQDAQIVSLQKPSEIDNRLSSNYSQTQQWSLANEKSPGFFDDVTYSTVSSFQNKIDEQISTFVSRE